ncbi:MAG: hypothetical protein SEPTF4163_001668 [Sporothrix epigloea]
MASGVAGHGSGHRNGVRLRRVSTSYDEHRNSFSSVASQNASNNIHESANANANANASSSPPAAFRRRSSNFSDYSQDARDFLNLKPLDELTESLRHNQPTSNWDSLPLAFALLPAVGGLLFQGGSSFVTDLLLLCLGGVFLHWSVTQPWTWYHSSQQIREENEANAEFAVDTEPEEEVDDDIGNLARSSASLEDVEEDEENNEQDAKDARVNEESAKHPDGKRKPLTPDERVAAYNKKQREKRRQERRAFQTLQRASLSELYRHEILALLSCFVFPVLGAYLLHGLRSQLTRPSEGLISNFNLTVFIMAAEVRPLRHFLQLVQSRTLHLQRTVHANPYRAEEERYRKRRAQEEQEQNQVLSELLQRFETLERQTAATPAAATPSAKPPLNSHYHYSTPLATPCFSTDRLPPSPPSPASASPKPLRRSRSEVKRDRDQLLYEVREQLQPELYTLARALRRTHKQQTLLETQVVAKFRATDQRLSDALALASAVASHGHHGWGGPYGRSNRSPSFIHFLDVVWTTLWWLSEAVVTVLLYLPRRAAAAAVSVASFPLWAVQAVCGKAGGSSNQKRSKRQGSRKVAAAPLCTPAFVMNESRKSTRTEPTLLRSVDYDYAAMSSSGTRQSRMGFAA